MGAIIRRVWFAVSLLLYPSLGSAEPLGGQVDKFAAVFNSRAKATKSTLRIAKASCSAEVRAVCEYVVTNNITILATSMEDKKTLGDLDIHMDGTPRDAVIYFKLIDMLMGIFAPKASDDERRVILAQLVRQIAEERVPRVELDGLEVSVLIIPGVASITSVNRGDIGMDSSLATE